MKYVLATVLFALSVGCSTTAQNPQQVVFQMRGTQNVLLRAAVEYKELKTCENPKVQPCADKGIVNQLQLADRVTDTALNAAETAVRVPGFGKSIIDSAIAAAGSALSAFQTIVTFIQGK